MNELKQQNLPKHSPSQSNRNCIYISPSDAVVDAYAHAVCDALEKKFGIVYGDHQAEFIRVSKM